MNTLAPGWYDDGHGQLRWWDGTAWTEHVAPMPSPADTSPPSAATTTPPSTQGTVSYPAVEQQSAPGYPNATGANTAATTPSVQSYSTPGPTQYAYGNTAPLSHDPYQTPSPAPQKSSRALLWWLIGGLGALIVAIIVVVIVLVVTLGSNGGGGISLPGASSSDPLTVAKTVYAAQENTDCDQFTKFTTKNFQNSLAPGESFSCEVFNNLKQKQNDFTGKLGGAQISDIAWGTPVISGDSATVEQTSTVTLGSFTQKVSLTFSLVKESGNWKVDGEKIKATTN